MPCGILNETWIGFGGFCFHCLEVSLIEKWRFVCYWNSGKHCSLAYPKMELIYAVTKVRAKKMDICEMYDAMAKILKAQTHKLIFSWYRAIKIRYCWISLPLILYHNCKNCHLWADKIKWFPSLYFATEFVYCSIIFYSQILLLWI